MGSTNTQTNACVMATLAIPNDAVQVIAAPPETISQRNVEAATGVHARAYLETIRDPGFPLAVTRLGKLRIVNRAAFVQWLEKGAFGHAREGDFVPMHSTAPPREEGTRDESGLEKLLGTVGLRKQRSSRRPRRQRQR